MTRLAPSAIREQMATIDDRLANRALSRPRRLALLRRQAQLVDQREAALDRARRTTTTR